MFVFLRHPLVSYITAMIWNQVVSINGGWLWFIKMVPRSQLTSQYFFSLKIETIKNITKHEQNNCNQFAKWVGHTSYNKTFKTISIRDILLNPFPYGLFNKPKIMGGQIYPPSYMAIGVYFCQTPVQSDSPVQVSRTRSWLCFPCVTRTTNN